MRHRSGFSDARKTGAADRIPGASVVKLGLRSQQQQQFVVKIGKEESGSQCDVVKEARKKEGALTLWR